MKKFELTNEFITFLGRKLFRIKALVEFGDVKAGETGGYIEKEENLSQSGNAWVSGNARVSGNAWVYGNARVYGNAQVSDNAQVSGNARVYGNAQVSGNAWVYGNARVYGNAWVSGNARVFGDAQVSDNAQVSGNALVFGDAQVSDNARFYGNAQVSDNARVYKDLDFATVGGFGSEQRTTTFFRQQDGSIGVRCGCFYGTIDQFREEVTETHGDTKYAKEYLMIADLMEMHFKED